MDCFAICNNSVLCLFIILRHREKTKRKIGPSNFILKWPGGGGRRVSSEAWDRVSMITPVKKCGRARLSTGLWETSNGWLPWTGCVCKKKSSSCPTSRSRTFWGIGDKCSNVNLPVGTPQYELDYRHEYFIRANFVAVSYQRIKLGYFVISDLHDGIRVAIC